MIAHYRGHASDLPLAGDALSAFFDAWTPPPLREESVSLDAAHDRVLARDVRSPGDLPAHPRSAMDGFAVCAASLRRAEPEHPLFLALEAEAWRVATGAPLPRGTDAVVRIEDVFVDASRIGVFRSVEPGADVVAAGEDIAAAAVVAPAGTVVNAAMLGVLAALGFDRVAVYCRPSVALVSTGDEVVPVDATPRRGEVRDSNGATLGAVLRAFGAGRITAAHVRDDVESLDRAFVQALETHDAVVVSGGSSVGARDFTSTVLAKREPPGVVVHGVRMKPGRPVLLAAAGSRPILGLPGNPTAATLAAMALGYPIFAKLTGRPACAPASFGVAAEPLHGKAGWDCYVPVRLDAAGGVRPVEHFCSTFVSSLVDADGYVHIAAEQSTIAPGDVVRVCRLP